MEIKNAISFYDFLGNLGILGGITLSIILTLFCVYLLVSIVEKLTKSEKSIKRITIGAGLTILTCSIILTFLASSKKEELNKVNAIKFEMLARRYRWSGFRELAQGVNFSSEELAIKPDQPKFKERTDMIRQLVEKYPDEFHVSGIANQDSLDYVGVELIDTTAVRIIDKSDIELCPLLAAKVKYYMRIHGIDSMSYQNIRTEIDDRCQDYVIDMMIGRNLNCFMPILFNGSKEYGLKLLVKK